MARSRPTQRQIAEEIGVSRTTVSLVLNNVSGMHISPETRQRILEVARHLHSISPDDPQLAEGRKGQVRRA